MGEWQETGFGKILKEWNVVKFSDALKIKGRIGWKGYKTSDLRDYGPVVIGGVNIKSNIYLDYSTLTHLSREKYEESPEIMLKKGDVILVTRGNGIGDVGRFNGEYHEATINPSVVIFSDFSGDSKFLYYFLSSPQGNDQIMSLESGSSIPALYQGLLKTLELPFPEISTQKAIASALSSLDDKIDLLHRQNKTLEAMAETLFRQWFVEEAQEDWEEGCLGDVIEIFDHLRIPLSKMERDKKKDGQLYPYYGAAKVMDYINDYIFDGDYILLGEDGTVRTDEGYPILQYANGKFWANNHTHVIKAKPPYNNFFLWNYLSKRNIDEIVTGAVQPKINQGNLKALDFPRYPDDLVAEFNEQTESFFKKINQNKTQILTLEKLRDTLLPKFMSGEVRVEYEN